MRNTANLTTFKLVKTGTLFQPTRNHLALIVFSLSIFMAQSTSAFFKKVHVEKISSLDRQQARIILPSQYKQKEKWPLVLLLHGYSASGRLQDFYMGLSRRVNRFGFILLVPEGIKDSTSKRFWNATDFCCDFENSGSDDSAYLQELIEKTKANFRIDSNRVYIIGHSNGAFMANRLACDTRGIFAGIASFAGGSFRDLSKCASGDPIAYLQIHAENDPIIAWNNDARFLTGSETLEYWINRNGCKHARQAESLRDLILTIPKNDTHVTNWSYCRSGADVELWKIRRHTSKIHKPHTPLLKREFSDQILSFLMRQSNEYIPY